MSVNNPIQIVRALWGNNFNIHKEVPKTPIFKNEIVLVWGIKNQAFLKNLGYSTILKNLANSTKNTAITH
jgi:hypothetical protein